MNKDFKAFLVILLMLSSLSACKNLFLVGLGKEIDLEAPQVSLTSPDTGSFLTGTVELRGQASDDQSIQRVELSFDRGNTWRAVDSYDPTTNKWSYELDSTAFPDGRLIIRVRVTDNANRVSKTDNLVYNVDNNPPVILVTEPRRYSDLIFNTRAVLTVTAADVHAIRKFGSIVEQSTDDGNTWTEIETQEVEQSTTWTKVFETTANGYTSAADPKAIFRFFIWAEDEAGNRSDRFYQLDRLNEANSRTWTADILRSVLDENSPISESIRNTAFPDNHTLDLRFDEDGDIPIIEWIAPAAAGEGDTPEASSRGLLAGLFRDDDGIDLETARIKIERQGSSDDWVTIQDWIQPELTAADIRSVSWSFRLPQITEAATFRALLEVADLDGTLSRPFSQLFRIGTPPSIEITRMEISRDGADPRVVEENFNGQFVNNDLRLYFSASAGGGAGESVQVRLDNGIWIEADRQVGGDFGGLYRATVPMADVSDGDRTIHYRVTDASDVTTARLISVVVDKTPPEIGFLTDSPEGVYRTVRVRGFVEDVNPLERIYLWIGAGGTTEPPVNLDAWDREVSGSYSWFYDFDTTIEDPQGTYRLVARARDRAGNLSEPAAVLTLNLNQEADRPQIELTNLTLTGPNRLSSPIITGIVTDDDRVAGDSLQIRIRPVPGEWASWQGISTTSDVFRINWSYNLGDDRPDGQYEMEFRARDTIARIMADGQEPIDDSDNEWNRVYRFNWNRIGPVPFTIAANPPAITVQDPDVFLFANGQIGPWDSNIRHAYHNDFTIRGTVLSGTDNTTLQYQVRKSGNQWSSNWTDIGSFAAMTEPTEWQFTVPVNDPGMELDEGEHHFRVRAIDSLGGLSISPSSGEYVFFVDRTSPVVDRIEHYTAGVNNRLRVFAKDETYVFGLIWTTASNPGPDPSSWSVPGDNTGAYIEKDFRASNDGYTNNQVAAFESGRNIAGAIYYAVRDKAGNWSEVYVTTSPSVELELAYPVETP